MTASFSFEKSGIAGNDVRAYGGKVTMNAVRAINRGADRGRTIAAKRIREEIAFPASYLNPSEGRLVVSRKATSSRLEAMITARTQPTQLSRFVISGTPSAKTGVSLRVKPGAARFSKRMVLINQRSGNIGLAIRLKPGESLMGAKAGGRPTWRGLTFLYAPSVDQAFKSLRADVSAEIVEVIETEFARLMQVEELK